MLLFPPPSRRKVLGIPLFSGINSANQAGLQSLTASVSELLITHDGHGIGLYYSKKKILLIHGNLQLYDNSEIPDNLGGPTGQRGATAILTIPLAKTSSP